MNQHANQINDMKKKGITLFIGCAVLIFIFLWGIYDNKHLEHQGILLQAKTLEWATTAKMGMSLRYEFYYLGKRQTSNNAFNKIRGLQVFENKYFPLIYDPNTGTSQLLIDPTDFRRFNLSFPDSLSWVLPYLK